MVLIFIMNDSDKNTTLYYNGNEDKNLFKIMTYPSTFIECISTYDKCNVYLVIQ